MDNFTINKELLHALKMISPGTPLRNGLDNVLKAKTGALGALKKLFDRLVQLVKDCIDKLTGGFYGNIY